MRFTIFLVIISTTILPQIPLYSQIQTRDTISIDEVVVTGAKIEIAEELAPISVSNISQQELENTGETNILTAISTYVPGVFVTERNILGFGESTGGSGTINIRGTGGSPNTRVLILIDGQPQYQGIFGHPLPDTYGTSDVKKVEIIRGPASILYGSNAMAGAINIITQQQREEGLKGSLQASYGSYNTQRYGGHIGYKKEKINVYATFNHAQTDGIRQNTDFNITNGYTKIGYQFNDHFYLTGDFSLAKYNNNDNGSIYTEEPQPFSTDIQRGKTSISLENKHKQFEGSLKLYHNFGTNDLSDGWYSTDRNSGVIFYETMQLFEGNKLTAGIDAKQYGGKGNSGIAKDSMIIINELAFYTYMQQTLFQKLTLSAGLRIENNSNFGNVLVPMAGLNYNPSSSTTIKSSVSKGFRSPTVMEMYLFVPNPELKPEEMMNYEISWLQSFLNNKLHTEITLFATKGNNLIQTEGQYPNIKRQNVGSFSNKGIEFALHFQATKNLFINANYSYLDLGKVILAAPEQQINLSTNYQFKNLNINISAQHIDNLYTKIDPQISESYTLINARLNAKITQNINIFVMANNILNEKYEINYGYPMPKTHFFGGIKLTF